jgi:hypothetical protein
MVRLIIIPRRQGRGSGIIDRTEPAAVTTLDLSMG